MGEFVSRVGAVFVELFPPYSAALLVALVLHQGRDYQARVARPSWFWDPGPTVMRLSLDFIHRDALDPNIVIIGSRAGAGRQRPHPINGAPLES